MNKVRELLREVIEDFDLDWDLASNSVTVHFGESGRKQRVMISRHGDDLAFRSVVLPSRDVTRSRRRRRDLARHVWRRNTRKQLVCFTFDERDRLIGQILQPAETLDAEELVLYVNMLARECDEYEYRLSGDDRF